MATVTKTAGTVVSSGTWSGLTAGAGGSLTTSDNTRASTTSATYDLAVLRNFAFAIPGDESTINGITTSFEFSTSNAAGTAYVKTRISVNAGSAWSSYGTERTNATTTDGTQTNGGSADTWGLSLTQSNVNDNTNFYVELAGHNNGTRQCRVDYFTVTVDYTAKYRLTASVTDWAVDGKNVVLAVKIITGVTDWAVAGQNLTSLKTARKLTCSSTDWAIAGQNVTLAVKMPTAVTDWVITPQDLNSLKVGRKIITSVTDWAISGQNITLDTAIHPEVTDWAISTVDANLVYTPVTGKKITCEATDWAVTPQDLTALKADRKLSTSATDWAIAGQDLTALKISRKLTTEVTDWQVQGQDLTILKASRLLPSSVTAWTFSGQDLTGLSFVRKIVTEVINWEIVGQDADLRTVLAYSLETEVTAFTISGKDLALYSARKLYSEAVGLTIDPQNINLTPAGADIRIMISWELAG